VRRPGDHYETLSRTRLLAGNNTFDATGELIATLTQIARAELTRPAVDSDATEVDLVQCDNSADDLCGCAVVKFEAAYLLHAP
jgi:hypothetical protein